MKNDLVGPRSFFTADIFGKFSDLFRFRADLASSARGIIHDTHALPLDALVKVLDRSGFWIVEV